MPASRPPAPSARRGGTESGSWLPVPQKLAGELQKAARIALSHRTDSRAVRQAQRRMSVIQDQIAMKLFNLPGVHPLHPLTFKENYTLVRDPRPSA